jgi:hypothetical protein
VINFIHVEWMKFQVQMNCTFHALKGLRFWNMLINEIHHTWN